MHDKKMQIGGLVPISSISICLLGNYQLHFNCCQ